MGEMRKSYEILIDKPPGKWPLGRQLGWENYIGMDLKEIENKGVNSVGLA
jgi:hypothetical protein